MFKKLVVGRMKKLLMLICLGGCARSIPLYRSSGDMFSSNKPKLKTIEPLALAAEATQEEIFAQVVERFSNILDEAKSPGAALAVVIDGKLAFSTGIGLKKPGGDPVDADTLFRVASMSKMVTAAAVLALADQGRLALEDPLTRHIPYLTRGPDYDASAITVAMALAQTSGLPDDGVVRCASGTNDPAHYFAAHGNDPLWSPPGRLFNYSNTNYTALAGVIAAVSGHTFEDAMQTLVFQPAHMSTATYSVDVAEGSDHAFGMVGGKSQDIDAYDCEYIHGPGGVIASVKDYAHFIEALYARDGTALQPASVDLMMAPHASIGDAWSYGYGLFTGAFADTVIVQHGGSLEDVNTYFVGVPSRRFALIAFVDAAGAAAGSGGWITPAIDAFLSTSLANAHPSVPEQALDKYTGHFVDPAGALGKFEIRKADGGLEMISGPGKGVSIVPSGTFFFAADGNVEYFATRAGVGKWVGP
jgi:D-alanyl-D-alanine carboxypeptidase